MIKLFDYEFDIELSQFEYNCLYRTSASLYGLLIKIQNLVALYYFLNSKPLLNIVNPKYPFLIKTKPYSRII